jgi:hypothetical protein
MLICYTDDVMDVGPEDAAAANVFNGTTATEPTNARLSLLPQPLSTEELSLREQCMLKVKVLFPGFQPQATGSSTVVKTRVEGTDIVTFRLGPGAQAALSHVHLSVSLVHCKAITELGKTANIVSTQPAQLVVKVSVVDVVEEVWRQLWLGGIVGKADIMVLPRGLRIGSTDHAAGKTIGPPDVCLLQFPYLECWFSTCCHQRWLDNTAVAGGAAKETVSSAVRGARCRERLSAACLECSRQQRSCRGIWVR